MRRAFRGAFCGWAVLVALNACGSRSGLLGSERPLAEADDPGAGSGGANALGAAAGHPNGGSGRAGGSAQGGTLGIGGTHTLGGSGGKALAGAAGNAFGGDATLSAGAGGGGEPEPGCGDGVVQDGEQCDDSNALSGDGCSAKCRWEPIEVSLSYYSACALGKNGAVKCWGASDFGQLGQGSTKALGYLPGQMGDNLPALKLGTGRHATRVEVGYGTACALLDDRSLKCWGSNNNGQLGLGDTNNRGDEPNEMGDDLPAIDLGQGRSAVQVACGFQFTCALLDNGQVKCWGYNHEGELGLGDTHNRGDQRLQMGDNLPPVELGSGRTATQISSLISTSVCALLDNGQVKCWGYNGAGALGLGDVVNRGDQPGQMGDALSAVNLGAGLTALSVAAGAYQTCALLSGASVKCWGIDFSGNLGTGTSGDRGSLPSDMGDDLPAVNFGSRRKPSSVAAGVTHVCAVFDDGALKCWGANGFGQLGTGDTNNRGYDPAQLGDAWPTVDVGTGKSVRQATAGAATTCALLTDGTVKCWGANGGLLGLGDLTNRGNKPGQMGDALPPVDLAF